MSNKRLTRIQINIAVIAIVIAAIALFSTSPKFSSRGVLIGGSLAFFYFLLLTRTVLQTFGSGLGEEGLDHKIAGRLGFKLLAYTFGLALITLAVILTRICQPLSFLAGFTALPVSISFEALLFAAFGTSDKETSENE